MFLYQMNMVAINVKMFNTTQHCYYFKVYCINIQCCKFRYLNFIKLHLNSGIVKQGILGFLGEGFINHRVGILGSGILSQEIVILDIPICTPCNYAIF